MEASAAVQSRLIGAIFVEKKLITEAQLEEALHLQETTGDRFGEIVVAKFGVGRLELAGVLAEQWAKYEQADRDAAPASAGPDLHVVEPGVADEQVRRPLGEISIEQGFITSEQLDAALEAQRETGGRIGEILVEQGSLTRLDLASALAEQWSALQKLRPPGPVADPQPWQNGSAAEPTAERGAAVADLEARLQAIEQAAGTTPWQEDLNRLTSELRAAVAAVEQRFEAGFPGTADGELAAALETIGGRIDALENVSVSSELDALRQQLEDLGTRPASVEGLADLRAAVERLESRPDGTAEIAHLAGEIAALDKRLDELAGVGELTDAVTVVAGQAGAAQAELAELSRRIDDLAGLEARLDEMTARLQAEDVIEELRQALAELATQTADGDPADRGAEITSLVVRLDEVAARVAEVAARSIPDLTPRMDDLSARVEEVAAAIPVIETEVLAARIESLEEWSRAGNGTLERLATQVDALGELESSTQERLAEISSREPDPAPFDELRARLDELAAAVGRESDSAAVDELRGRLDELAAAVARESDTAAVDELRLRVNLLAATVEREPDRSVFDELNSRLDELAAAAERDESVSALEARFGELERRLAAATPAEEIREEIQARLDELAARPIVDRGLQEQVGGMAARLEGIEAVAGTIAELRSSLEGLDALRVDESQATGTRLEELHVRLDDLAAAVARESDSAAVAELRARVDALVAAVEREPDTTPFDELRARLDDLAVTVARESDSAAVAELRARLDELAAAVERGSDSAAIEELRLRVNLLAATVQREPDTSPLDELRARVDELAAAVERDESITTLEARLGELEQRLAAAAPAEELREEMRRVAESTVVERESLAHALFARVEEIAATVPREDELADVRARLDELVERPTMDQALQERVDGMAARLEGIEAVEGMVAELRSSVEGLDALRVDDSFETGTRIGGLEAAVEALAGLEARVREGVDRDWADRARASAARLDGVENRLEAVGALEEKIAALAEADDARATGHRELGDRIDEALDEIRVDVHAKASTFGSQLHAQSAETAALRAQIQELQEAASGQAAVEARLETMVAQRLDELESRLAEEVATVRGETGSLGARIDELRLRHRDVQKAKAAAERLAERVDVLDGVRAEDAEAAQVAAVELDARLEGLALSLRAEAAGARSAVDGLAEQVGELSRLRSEDLARAEVVATELAARLDDEARSAKAAGELERALRKELADVAARLEESDAGAIEAREELRGELERVASSMGWRLERIEESLASDGTAALEATVTELERRLEQQVAIGEEQVRVTERALRKGLASLGERLADTESAYVDAGKAMRRSIERLGAAVVEADARMAHQIPVSEAEGCVAFAPTAAGYRLIELPGKPPEVGSTIELESFDGGLVVTGYGRSPLPLDSRACAYLDRA